MKPELQKRLVKFSAGIIWLARDMKPCVAGKHLYSQLIRSATSSALNYGEAQTAETRKDFAHKLGIVLKELKETEVNMEIIIESGILKTGESADNLLKECRELIAIFTVTRNKAKKNAGE